VAQLEDLARSLLEAYGATSISGGFIGSVHKVGPAPLLGPRVGIPFPVFETHSHGPELAHGIGVLLLLEPLPGSSRPRSTGHVEREPITDAA
jgi:hypothetical protein